MPFYAVLRSVANKLLGVIAMSAVIYLIILVAHIVNSRSWIRTSILMNCGQAVF